MIDPATFVSLAGSLSPVRIQPYVLSEGGDLDRALRLYTWNVEVSSACWGVLHAVEIALRNAMHAQLVMRFGRDDWWKVASLTHVGVQMVDSAKDSAGKVARLKQRSVVPGDVGASLSFGFWSGLTGRGGRSQYETQFWQPALVRAFPNKGQLGRSDVSRTLESIRLFRNRIAHHEPVHGRHLAADHVTLLSVAGWIDADLERYVDAHSRVPGSLARRTSCVTTGVGTSF